MSDTSSAVTYTSVYTDSKPWRYYEEESAKAGSPRVIVYGYDGLFMQPVAPPSPDYVPGPEHPPSLDYVPGPEYPPPPIEIPYVPKLEYPEYLVPSNAKATLEDQPLRVDASPIAASPGYVANSDPNEDPEEDPDDDHADYPTGGIGDDEPSDDEDDHDDTDDEDEEPFKDEEDDEDEEEHLALADSSAVPIVDPVLLAGDTETCLRRAWKTVRLEPPMSSSIEACIARHAALLSPPLPIPSPPLPLPSPITISPTDPRAPLGYRAIRIRIRASRMTDIPEADVPPRKRAFLTTLTPGFEVGESSTTGVVRQPWPKESDLRRYRVEQTCYGITGTLDEIVDTLMEIDPTAFEGSTREDRLDHHRTAMLLDREAMYAREACVGSEDRSAAIAAYKLAFKKRTTRATPTTTTTPTTTITDAHIQALINRGVAAALAERNADMSTNVDNSNDSGTGTEGAIGLTRWLEKIESLFQISNCTVTCQVKFTSCTLQGSALTWWNSYMRAVGQDVAFTMPWVALKRMITDKYCPR
nr:reverse transcriptase domain-containing protein [Tanacetum cinerariifolium]